MAEIEVETVADLEPFRQEWTELATRSRSVFKTWEWLSTWWDHFGQDRHLMVVAVRSQDRLVGILPLYRWRSRPLRVLRFLGHAVGDELGPVCAPADRPLMASALRRVLGRVALGPAPGRAGPAEERWGAVLGGRVLAREGNPVLQFGADGLGGLPAQAERQLPGAGPAATAEAGP